MHENILSSVLSHVVLHISDIDTAANRTWKLAVHVPAAKEKIQFTFSTYCLFLLSFDFSSTTLALAVVCLRSRTSGGFGTTTRRSLLLLSRFRWYGATTVLFLPVTRQEITDGGFNAWTETVVHLWVHDLCDDSVHTRFQHTRSRRNTEKKKKRLSHVCFQSRSNTSLPDVHKRVSLIEETYWTTLCLRPFLI